MRRKSLIWGPLVLAMAGLGVFGYTRALAHLGGVTPPDPAVPEARADAVVVQKSRRALQLLRAGQVIRSYEIALGADPVGPKQREGDERTPEGLYRIDWRNPQSSAYLSLHISYPDRADVARATGQGESPGGNIMIHGLPNGWGAVGGLHRLVDWTDGCIGVTNDEMREIWALVPDGTPITLMP